MFTDGSCLSICLNHGSQFKIQALWYHMEMYSVKIQICTLQYRCELFHGQIKNALCPLVCHWTHPEEHGWSSGRRPCQYPLYIGSNQWVSSPCWSPTNSWVQVMMTCTTLGFSSHIRYTCPDMTKITFNLHNTHNRYDELDMAFPYAILLIYSFAT